LSAVAVALVPAIQRRRQIARRSALSQKILGQDKAVVMKLVSIGAEEKGEECPSHHGQSFEEGCTEYYDQRDRFEKCEEAKKR
jgi:hypothetical protein